MWIKENGWIGAVRVALAKHPGPDTLDSAHFEPGGQCTSLYQLLLSQRHAYMSTLTR